MLIMRGVLYLFDNIYIQFNCVILSVCCENFMINTALEPLNCPVLGDLSWVRKYFSPLVFFKFEFLYFKVFVFFFGHVCC